MDLASTILSLSTPHSPSDGIVIDNNFDTVNSKSMFQPHIAPMAYSPHRHSISTDRSYQRYLLLSNQQSYLRQRLCLPSQSMSPLTVTTPEDSSIPSSPTGYSHRMSFPLSYSMSPPSVYQMHASRPTPAVPVASSATQASDDSKALYDVNQQIKATLTDLLNTDSVRQDDKFRLWIQSRLMDAEMELKRQRRRRSSASVDSRGIAESIAGHMDPHHAVFRW